MSATARCRRIVATLLALASLSAPALAQSRPPAAVLRPQDAPLSPLHEAHLFRELERADLRNRPQIQRLPGPGGGTAITYRRQSGDPPLSPAELRRQLEHPPRYEQERSAILRLLQALRRLGVTLVLGPPRRNGAMAEWEPKSAVLRIRPDASSRGTRVFARILNHEAIHVAQSCRAGSLRARPVPLGLPRPATATLDLQLSHPVYSAAGPSERVVEQEAYANHNRLDLALALLARHCARQPGHTAGSESGSRARATPP
ncbi:MAG: hypothetical protein ACKO5F_16800 [Synechococcus sp.]